MYGLDVQFNIISYAVISTKFESSSNIIESFVPLLEHALYCMEKDYVEEININDAYEEIYGYRIHSAILNQLLKVLQKQKKIERLKRECIQINKETLCSYDVKEEYDIKLRALVSDFDIFCKRRGYEFNREEILKSIIEFLQKNALDFNSFINYKSNMESNDEDNELFNNLVDFLLDERRNSTKNYELVKEIFEGIVLSSIIIHNEQSFSSVGESFSIENALLDSNYIFRLLDLQTSLEHQAAQDTYEALRVAGCNFWVCKETIEQIAVTIRAFASSCTETTNSVLRLYGDTRFTGLASACLRRSLTTAKLEKIIDELEDVLKDRYNVNFIDDNDFNFELIDTNDERFRSLQEVKIDSSEKSIVHDLLLLKVVSANRPRTFYKATQAHWWVLTDDNKLTNWNTKNSYKRDIPECMTEAQLATVMWLCNPKTASLDGLFNTVIALRSQGLIGNGEYTKISKQIERQKERYSGDESSLKKLSFVLSQRVLSVDELLCEDHSELDAKFDQMLSESQEQIEESRQKIAEQEDSIRLQAEKVDELSREIHASESLLTEQTEKLIKSLKARHNDKELEYGQKQKLIDELRGEDIKRINRCDIALKVIVIVLLCVLFLFVLPLIDSLEEWYSKHQFLCFIATSFVSFVAIYLELKVEFFVNLSKRFSKIVIALLVKAKLIRNIDFEIESLENQRKSILQEMNKIQNEIDDELIK